MVPDLLQAAKKGFDFVAKNIKTFLKLNLQNNHITNRKQSRGLQNHMTRACKNYRKQLPMDL